MIVIIDYGMGNVQSVKNAIEKLGFEATVSRQKKDIAKAEKLILPGVGAFKDGMENLRRFGLIETLQNEVVARKKPILGICLGMQLLANNSEEGGMNKGLGWIDSSVKRLKSESNNIKIPHIGWNNIKIMRKDRIFKNMPDNSDYYFVHSYHLVPASKEIITSMCIYGQEFVSSINKDNIYATQFHPEKSQDLGLKILENFIENA
jgi:imidazole glycerol-phosphate synthase subunit HisH